jgi:hypothetical protein
VMLAVRHDRDDQVVVRVDADQRARRSGPCLQR